MTHFEGLSWQLRPDPPGTFKVMVTLPWNPRTEVTVMVNEPTPAAAAIVIEVGLTATVKSCRLKVTITLWVPLAVPFVPVTVTL